MGWLTALLQIGGSVMGMDASKRAGAETARLELESSRETAKQIRRRAIEARGAARAGFAASGVDVDSGTPKAVDEQMIWDSEYDVMNTLLSGKRRAAAAKEGGQVQAQQYAINGAGAAYSAWLTARERSANKAAT
jgi:hypothetical protein